VIEASIAAFGRARVASGQRAANTDSAPVFIVGMARFGTTLCEQILAAHVQAHDAGERAVLGQAFAALGSGTDMAPVRRIVSLDAPTLDAAAAANLAALHALAPDRTWIVDKLPGNYLYLGLLGLLLPGVQIIHCVRDPRNIGLLIYTFRFHGSQGYAHDLGDRGGTIAQSDRLMAHWRPVLPNPILTVRSGCRLLRHRAMPHGAALVPRH
jgi:hypothetical protein